MGTFGGSGTRALVLDPGASHNVIEVHPPLEQYVWEDNSGDSTNVILTTMRPPFSTSQLPPGGIANGDFEDGTSGWHLSPGSAMAVETAIVNSGKQALKFTSSGGASWLFQDVANPGTLKGKAVTFGAWVYATAANSCRLEIWAGDPTQEASYSQWHPGDATWHRLTVTRTIEPGAPFVRVHLQIVTGNTTGYIDDAVVVVGD